MSSVFRTPSWEFDRHTHELTYIGNHEIDVAGNYHGRRLEGAVHDQPDLHPVVYARWMCEVLQLLLEILSLRVCIPRSWSSTYTEEEWGRNTSAYFSCYRAMRDSHTYGRHAAVVVPYSEWLIHYAACAAHAHTRLPRDLHEQVIYTSHLMQAEVERWLGDMRWQTRLSEATASYFGSHLDYGFLYSMARAQANLCELFAVLFGWNADNQERIMAIHQFEQSSDILTNILFTHVRMRRAVLALATFIDDPIYMPASWSRVVRHVTTQMLQYHKEQFDHERGLEQHLKHQQQDLLDVLF